MLLPSLEITINTKRFWGKKIVSALWILMVFFFFLFFLIRSFFFIKLVTNLLRKTQLKDIGPKVKLIKL